MSTPAPAYVRRSSGAPASPVVTLPALGFAGPTTLLSANRSARPSAARRTGRPLRSRRVGRAGLGEVENGGLEEHLGVGVRQRDGHRVLLREARGAERLGRRAGGGAQPVELEVRERVDVEVLTDLANGEVGREQLAPAPGVHPVEARPP